MWLSTAAGRVCRNLDAFLMGEENLSAVFDRAARDADVSIVEGNTGLFDSMDLEGRGSTAHLAKLLQAPVVLVVDCRGMNRGIAPLLQGYRRFDPELPIAGVILNRIGGARHEAKLRAALQRYCSLEVLGALPDLRQVTIPERHLGLLPVKEDAGASALVAAAAEAIQQYVDVDRILQIARSAPSRTVPAVPEAEPAAAPVVRVGVAMDRAFTFYYPENLEALQAAGAELVPFSPLEDSHLPAVDGLYLGGGFPEVFMSELEANHTLRGEIRAAIEAGMPVYAECGGLMYLARRIAWDGVSRNMVGALPCDVRMTGKPQGHGYVVLEETGRSPWPSWGSRIRGHEFHHSQVVHLDRAEFAYKVVRGQGIDGRHDGLIHRRVVASYAHVHSVGTPRWAERFVAFVKHAAFRDVAGDGAWQNLVGRRSP